MQIAKSILANAKRLDKHTFLGVLPLAAFASHTLDELSGEPYGTSLGARRLDAHIESDLASAL